MWDRYRRQARGLRRPAPSLSFGSLLGNLVAQLNQAEQDFVALRLQFLDGARSDLGMDTVDELLLRFPASIAASWLCLRFGVAASIYVFRHSPIVRT
jgi:hypothetical protein